MSQVKEYTIVTATSLNELTKLINAEIKNGWQPLGGVSIMPIAITKAGGTQHGFFQPMVK
jgi:hypothetical protein